MDSAERLGIVGTLRVLGVLGSVKQLAWGTQGAAGISAVSIERYTKKIDPTYEDMIQRYLAESRVKCAIDELADVSVGPGFYLTCAPGHEIAMERVGDFCEHVDMDGLNQMFAKDLWAVGNAIVWKQTSKELKNVLRVPINTVTKIDADRLGKVSLIEQKIKREIAVKVTDNDLDDLIHWNMNPIDTGIHGRGLLEAYVRQGVGYRWKNASTGKWEVAYRPPLAEIIEETEDMMRTAITRYTPRFLFDLQGFTDAEGTTIKDKLNEISWPDDLVVWYPPGKEKKLTPHRLTTDPRSRLDPFVKHFRDKELITTETPSVKLISEEGFTEASAKAAERIEMRRVASFQRRYKRRLERDIFKLVLTQPANSEFGMGYGPVQIKEANIRLHWGEETKPELTFEALHAAYVMQGITKEEYRKNLAKFGVELLEQTE